MKLRLVLGSALVAAAVICAALPAGASAANECAGLPRCVAVPGPWVAVPASGAADYMLECPGGKGIVGGTDALVSSRGIAVSFDGILGSPIAIGRTTHSQVLFRAVSGDGAAGFFEPFLGCIPTQGGGRVTTGVAAPVGPPLDLHVVEVAVVPGRVGRSGISCPAGERLAESWASITFATPSPPPESYAGAISVHTTTRGGIVSALVAAPASLPSAARARVQLGVGCETA
jgi:hypothetical protein